MKFRHEPAEPDDPVNAELDDIEARIARLIALGAEAPLRARLSRLLPVGPMPHNEDSAPCPR